MPALPDQREPLHRYIAAQQFSDAEMRILLRDSAREARLIVESYGDGFAAQVRKAQLDLARSQQQLWKSVGYQTEIGIGDGVDAASDSMAFMMETWTEGIGVSTQGMRYALLAQGRAGIDALVSKTANDIPLSQQVYRTSVASGQQLDRVIRALVVNGASAKEIAKRVHGFISPNTPGGASYAAMRLGRSELNNAFHTTSLRLNAENPMVEYMQWNLSGSHPKPDECNEYAESVHVRGQGRGVYGKGDVPSKPHPQCFCYVTPVVVSDDDFVANFHAGKYDSYIEGKLGGSRG